MQIDASFFFSFVAFLLLLLSLFLPLSLRPVASGSACRPAALVSAPLAPPLGPAALLDSPRQAPRRS